MKKYGVDESFFNKIDNEEKAYILGFIYADGNISKRGHLTIEIHKRDEHILHDIKRVMQYNGPLYYRLNNKDKNKKEQAALRII